EIYNTAVDAQGRTENSLLIDKFDGNIAIGYLSGYTYDEAKGIWTYTFRNGANMFGIANALTDNDAIPAGAAVVQKSTVDYTGLYGRQVKVIYNTEDNSIIYGVFAHESNVVLSTASGMIDSFDDAARTVKIDGTNYKMNAASGAIPVYLMNSGIWTNAGNQLYLDDLAAAQLAQAFTYDLVDNDGDGKIDVAIVTPKTVAQITYVGTDTVTFNNNVGVKNKDDLVMYDGYAQGDWVYFING
ncbi:hypothetical protein, partial [Pseudoflavonifractor phocaeensis]|uniref:hypothetical protein n=1 Tax=Pseudoflavonifractor phocaeensis TaxID=1870988 RepID=UPI00195EB1B4